MDVQKIFRTLIIVSWALAIFGIVVSEVVRDTLPPELKDYLQGIDDADLRVRDYVLFGCAVVGLTGYVVATVGMFRFSSWARTLYVGIYGAMMIVFLFDDPTVETSVEEFLGELEVLANGAILAIAYLTPVSKHFDRSAVS